MMRTRAGTNDVRNDDVPCTVRIAHQHAARLQWKLTRYLIGDFTVHIRGNDYCPWFSPHAGCLLQRRTSQLGGSASPPELRSERTATFQGNSGYLPFWPPASSLTAVLAAMRDISMVSKLAPVKVGSAQPTG